MRSRVAEPLHRLMNRPYSGAGPGLRALPPEPSSARGIGKAGTGAVPWPENIHPDRRTL